MTTIRHCEPTGPREARPDDRLREAIHLAEIKLDCFVASAPRNDEKTEAPMSASRSPVRPVTDRNGGTHRMSKISPCLFFNSEAEEAANFYVSLLPDSRIDKILRNPIDGPAGKAGSVLVVEFTLAGQNYMALNGGTRFEYTPAISFKIDCADQAEIDRLWDALSSNGGSEVRCGWVKDRYGVSWQVTPSMMPGLLGGPDRAGSERTMRAMMGMIKLDIAALQKAYDGG
jgi:predicted 3-demethylubiquinone-9 3-methyltransferase (glyoxalase superfamily)